MGYFVKLPVREELNIRLDEKLLIMDGSLADESKWDKLAAEAGITRSTLYRIKSIQNARPVKREFIKRLLEFLDMSKHFPSCLEEGEQIVIERAEGSDLSYIADAEKVFFGSDPIKQLRILKTYYTANSNGFKIFKIKEEIRGSLVLVPLRRPKGDRFLRGTISEEDILIEDIHPTSDKTTDLIYIESLITTKTMQSDRIQLMRELCIRSENTISELCSNKDRLELCALGVSGWSDIEQYGFKICTRKENREDGRDMFRCKYHEFITKLPEYIARTTRVLNTRF